MFSLRSAGVPALFAPSRTRRDPWATTECEYLDGEAPLAELEIYEDQTRGILSHNDSPDVGFDWSVNPYRGCFHACAYCYARPSHEYLSFGAGTDFDRKIVVKKRAPELLREAFDAPKWEGQQVIFSGVTDCYQPLEASYRLTRGCLEVCAEYRNPVGIITKAPLVERDIDVLQELSGRARLSVMISVPFWDEAKARAIEPFVTTPAAVRTIERLARAGIRVGVMVAPIIPGLNDEDMGEVLRAARGAGATHAGSVLLRLPGPVKDVFEGRLRAALPLRADRVLRRIRETRGGKMYDSRFEVRGTGEGVYAEAIAQLFEQTVQRLGFESGRPGDGGGVHVPAASKNKRQLALFCSASAKAGRGRFAVVVVDQAGPRRIGSRARRRSAPSPRRWRGRCRRRSAIRRTARGRAAIPHGLRASSGRVDVCVDEPSAAQSPTTVRVAGESSRPKGPGEPSPARPCQRRRSRRGPARARAAAIEAPVAAPLLISRKRFHVGAGEVRRRTRRTDGAGSTATGARPSGRRSRARALRPRAPRDDHPARARKPRRRPQRRRRAGHRTRPRRTEADKLDAGPLRGAANDRGRIGGHRSSSSRGVRARRRPGRPPLRVRLPYGG